MKKLIFIFLGLMIFASCEDLTQYDKVVKSASAVPAQTLFANAQKGQMDWLSDANVNLNIFRLIMQQWTETTYIDESNYDLRTRTIPDNQWHIIYRDVLKDLQEAKRVAGTGVDAGLLPGVVVNQKAMITIMETLAWSILIQTYGDIPYSQALDFNTLTPTYDDGATVAATLITNLDAALTALDPASGAFDDGSDLIYNNDIAKWKKFGNSLKLRLGMMLADSDPAKAKATVEAAVTAGVFTSNADNAIFAYKNAPPNTNQIWVNLVQSGRNDFVIADTYVNAMNAKADPRRAEYMTLDATGLAYTGGENGSNNNFATFSHVSDKVEAADFEGTVMDYSEVEFYLAEAVERGMTVPSSAAAHYNSAITANMQYWGVADADIATYLARPDVAYATATGTYKQKIGEQKWIALYNRGFESWLEWRRLDFPVIAAPPDALTATPVRYTYPVSEQNLNGTNYAAAASKIGGDLVTTKLFWDKF